MRAAGPDHALVPPALAARVTEALRAHSQAADPAHPSPDDCLAAGEGLLARLLRADEHTTRHATMHAAERADEHATALELLAADALVTHAFELAAADPERLEELALESMRRTAALVEAR